MSHFNDLDLAFANGLHFDMAITQPSLELLKAIFEFHKKESIKAFTTKVNNTILLTSPLTGLSGSPSSFCGTGTVKTM